MRSTARKGGSVGMPTEGLAHPEFGAGYILNLNPRP